MQEVDNVAAVTKAAADDAAKAAWASLWAQMKAKKHRWNGKMVAPIRSALYWRLAMTDKPESSPLWLDRLLVLAKTSFCEFAVIIKAKYPVSAPKIRSFYAKTGTPVVYVRKLTKKDYDVIIKDCLI